MAFDLEDVSYLEVGIEVRDLEASLRFYRDTLGLEPYGEGGIHPRRLYGLRLGGAIVKLMWCDNEWPTKSPRAVLDDRFYGYFHLTFKIPNAEALTRRCADAGYEIETPWTIMPSGLGYAYVRDPDGNLVHLATGASWRAPSDAFASGAVEPLTPVEH